MGVDRMGVDKILSRQKERKRKDTVDKIREDEIAQ